MFFFYIITFLNQISTMTKNNNIKVTQTFQGFLPLGSSILQATEVINYNSFGSLQRAGKIFVSLLTG